MRRVARTRAPRALALGLGCLLAISACGGDGPDETLIGVRKVNLALVFEDEKLKIPLPPKVIVQVIPAPQEVLQATFPELLPPPAAATPRPAFKAPTPPIPSCPKAADGTVPAEVASVSIIRLPVAGTYLRRNKGTIKLTGPIPISLPYPPITKIIVRNVKTTEVDRFYFGRVKVVSYEVEEQLTPTFRIVEHLQYDNDRLDLVKRETIVNGQVTRFTPMSAVQILAFNGPGSAWSGNGLDTEQQQSMFIDGRILPKQAVDVCGKVIDTMYVETNEREVEVKNQQTSGSEAGAPIKTNWALQNGGLVVRRESKTTRVIQSEGARAVLTIDVLSELLTLEPVVLP